MAKTLVIITADKGPMDLQAQEAPARSELEDTIADVKAQTPAKILVPLVLVATLEVLPEPLSAEVETQSVMEVNTTKKASSSHQ